MVQSFRSQAAACLFLLAVDTLAFHAPLPRFAAQRNIQRTIALHSTVERTAAEPKIVEEQALSIERASHSLSPIEPAASSAPIDLSKVSNVFTPVEAFEQLVQKGEYNASSPPERLLFSSALGGCYVGMGAMVSLAVAGNSAGIAAADPGLQKFIFAALFPMNLLLAQQCGGMLYTGNTASMMAAVCEKRVSWGDMGRVLALSWLGNLFGCALFAIACKYAGVMEGGAGVLAAKTLVAKTSAELGPVLIKAVFCNWLVCLAVVLSTQAKDMGGKYIAIWLPVSTFVSIGFEHSVANMFLLPAGLMSQDSITLWTALNKNLIPVTLGNALSGSLLVGATFSYLFGTLGKDSIRNYPSASPSQYDGKTASEVMMRKVSDWIADLSDQFDDYGTAASLTTTANTLKESTTTITNDAAAYTSQQGTTTDAITPSVFFASPIEEEVLESMEDMVLKAQRQAEKVEILMRQTEAEETVARDHIIAKLEAEKAELLDRQEKAETARAVEAEAARVAELEAEKAMQLFREAEEEAARLEEELAKLVVVTEPSSSSRHLPLVGDESLVVDKTEEVELKQSIALDEVGEWEIAVGESAPEEAGTSDGMEPLQVHPEIVEVLPATPPVMIAPTQSVPRSSNLRDLLGPSARRL